MLQLSTFLSRGVICVGNSPPIFRFCKVSGPPDNTISLSCTRQSAPKATWVRKPRCGSRVTSLRKEIGPARRPRRFYPPVPKEKKRQQHTALSSRRATWLVLQRPENLSAEDQHLLEHVRQAHIQVKAACELAQAFVQMIRGRDASALQPWLEKTLTSEVSELHTFAAGIKRDQDAVLAALTYEWSQGQVEGAPFRC